MANTVAAIIAAIGCIDDDAMYSASAFLQRLCKFEPLTTTDVVHILIFMTSLITTNGTESAQLFLQRSRLVETIAKIVAAVGCSADGTVVC